MQIIAGETHSCCRDSAHSWSQDSAGLGKVAPEAPKHDGHFRPSSCSPHSFERIRRPLLGAQSSNKPPGLPTTHPPPPPGCWGNWWALSDSPGWNGAGRGACPDAQFSLRDSWLSASLPLARWWLLLCSWLLLYRQGLPASPCLSSNLSLPSCLRVYVGKHELTRYERDFQSHAFPCSLWSQPCPGRVKGTEPERVTICILWVELLNVSGFPLARFWLVSIQNSGPCPRKQSWKARAAGLMQMCNTDGFQLGRSRGLHFLVQLKPSPFTRPWCFQLNEVPLLQILGVFLSFFFFLQRSASNDQMRVSDLSFR